MLQTALDACMSFKVRMGKIIILSKNYFTILLIFMYLYLRELLSKGYSEGGGFFFLCLAHKKVKIATILNFINYNVLCAFTFNFKKITSIKNISLYTSNPQLNFQPLLNIFLSRIRMLCLPYIQLSHNTQKFRYIESLTKVNGADKMQQRKK